MSEEKHPIVERRKDASAAVIHLIEHLQGSVDELQQTVSNHIQGLDDQRKLIISDLLREAFPEGDHEAHRRYHESLIKAANDKADFWRKMREELTKLGLIGFIGWLLVSMLQAIIAGIKAGLVRLG